MSQISIGKAAKMLGVHIETLRNWEREGKIKSIKTAGGHRRFILSEIEALSSPVHENVALIINGDVIIRGKIIYE